MLPKTYDPKPIEEKLIELWQKEGLFLSHVPENKDKKSFVIVIPPPNITGALHMGHALNDTLQDMLIRSYRMMGREALWVPGTDHGGIATQNVVEKKIAKEQKKHRRDLGREEFLKQMWQWRQECGNTILDQLKKLGCSLDLSQGNVRFTMDEARAKSVYEAFRRLWAKKYVYRGERMINWCVRCGTALSDIEVEHEQTSAKLWYFNYPLEDGSKGITIATTRPETMLGDTAVAVNPADVRYTHLVGKKLRLPIVGRLIPIIADEGVDLKFGTGAVKITPAHDPLDYEISQRHHLEIITIIDHEGRMINVPEKYMGMDRNVCRNAIIEDLKAAGAFEKEERYGHGVGTCYRCHQPIEPALSEQWFVHMKELAAPAIKAAEEERVKFHPESWKKPFLLWLNNIEDWCISRQIWWGHRIPAWNCESCGEMVVAEEAPAVCPKCGGALKQEEDVLDTWFSSGLWPFSVFGWPEKTPELDYYYPTSVLSTGYEILYLWVARMVMMGIELMGDVPFTDVYLHGIVRDKHGKKMSKSLGNVIDPLDLIAKYGTDAVRFALISQAFPGKDIPFSEESITGARNFCNKVYNAARFIHMNMPEGVTTLPLPKNPKHLSDRWILSRYAVAVRKASDCVQDYDLSGAANALYHFLWDEYCDWYIELAKSRLQTEEREEVLAILTHVLSGTMLALHPLMPFITEEIYHSFASYTGGGKDFLVKHAYPSAPQWLDDEAEREMETVMGVTSAIRTIRSHFNVPPSLKVKAYVSAENEAALASVRANADYIKLLAKLEELETGVSLEKPASSATTVYGSLGIFIPLKGLIDFAKERERLSKELGKIDKEIATCKQRLENKSFIDNAPAEQVDAMKARLAEATAKAAQVRDAIKSFE